MRQDHDRLAGDGRWNARARAGDPPYPPDLDCDDVPYSNIEVVGSDPHGFDGYDNDGRGCES